MYVCMGMIFAASGYLITKQNLVHDKIGFGITSEDGSWVGNAK